MVEKKLPWAREMLEDLGLEDKGGGFWSDPDGIRSVYLGMAAVIVISAHDSGGPDFKTQHLYPPDPDPSWLFSALTDHVHQLAEHAAGLTDDLELN